MSKRSNACAISQKVKEKVWNRDGQQCIICNRYVPKTNANAHYIKRSQGGLGIEQNIVTLCPECHYKQDFGQDSITYTCYIRDYLKTIYKDWNEGKLIYKKY